LTCPISAASIEEVADTVGDLVKRGSYEFSQAGCANIRLAHAVHRMHGADRILMLVQRPPSAQAFCG
jgi:hypothetical protein